MVCGVHRWHVAPDGYLSSSTYVLPCLMTFEPRAFVLPREMTLSVFLGVWERGARLLFLCVICVWRVCVYLPCTHLLIMYIFFSFSPNILWSGGHVYIYFYLVGFDVFRKFSLKQAGVDSFAEES